VTKEMDCQFRVGGLYRWKGLSLPFDKANYFHFYPCGSKDKTRNAIESSYRGPPGECFLFLAVIYEDDEDDYEDHRSKFVATCLAPDGTVHEASIPLQGTRYWEEVTGTEEEENNDK